MSATVTSQLVTVQHGHVSACATGKQHVPQMLFRVAQCQRGSASTCHQASIVLWEPQLLAALHRASCCGPVQLIATRCGLTFYHLVHHALFECYHYIVWLPAPCTVVYRGACYNWQKTCNLHWTL